MNQKLKIIGAALLGTLIILSLKYQDTLKGGELISNIYLKSQRQEQKITYIKTEDIQVATDKWKTSPPICLETQENDSYLFGSSFAINDKYLAVGDPGTNKVIIYSHNQSGDWIRSKEIKAPRDSIPHQVGSGFGRDLALDGNNLVITAYIPQGNIQVFYPEYRQLKTTIDSDFQGVYQTILNENATVEHINKPDRTTPLLLSITANGERLAFTSVAKNIFGQEINIINILSKGKIYRLPRSKQRNIPNNSYINDLALKDNLLVVSNKLHPLSDSSSSYAWLFDLNNPRIKPKDLSINNNNGYASVVISERLIAASIQHSVYNLYSGTVIKDIKNIAQTTIIDGFNFQNISLDKNLLARVSSPRAGILESGELEIFHIDDDNVPHLILKRVKNYPNRVALNDRWLVTSTGRKVCLEYLSQIEQY